MVDRPDRAGRAEILRVHTRGKPISKDIDLDTLAGQTPGFTGADLANLVNEAALLAARKDKKIIDELEPVKRGIYGGAVGYLAWNGNMDTAIAIRTAILKDGQMHVQAGAGVVADSIPELEWMETQNKARALMKAAELASTNLVK